MQKESKYFQWMILIKINSEYRHQMCHLSHLCFLPKKVGLSLFLALFSSESSSVIGSVFLLFWLYRVLGKTEFLTDDMIKFYVLGHGQRKFYQKLVLISHWPHGKYQFTTGKLRYFRHNYSDLLLIIISFQGIFASHVHLWNCQG